MLIITIVLTSLINNYASHFWLFQITYFILFMFYIQLLQQAYYNDILYSMLVVRSSILSYFKCQLLQSLSDSLTYWRLTYQPSPSNGNTNLHEHTKDECNKNVWRWEENSGEMILSYIVESADGTQAIISKQHRLLWTKPFCWRGAFHF